MTVSQGGSNNTFFYLNANNGFNSAVTLSVSGLPSGVTAVFGTNPTTYMSTLTFTADSTAPTGTYTVTVTGTSGTLTASTTMSLTIVAPSFTLSSGLALTVAQGGSNNAYIYTNGNNGFNGSVTLSVSNLPTGVTAVFGTNPTTSMSMLTFTAESTAPTGTYTVTVSGIYGSTTASTTISLTVAGPSFTLSTNSSSYAMNPGSYSNGYLYLNGVNGFSGAVSLSASGLPSGVTVSFASNPTSSYTTAMTITASSSAIPGSATVTITGTSGSTTVSTTMTIVVTGPTFNLSTLPGSIKFVQGTTATSSVAVVPVSGFSSNVTFSIGGLPSGVTAAWNPSTSSTSSVLTLTASSTAAAGKTTAVITGTSGALIVTAQLPVTVFSSASSSTTSLVMTSGGSTVSTVGWGNAVTLTASVAVGSSPVTSGVVNFCDSAASYCSDIHLLGSAQLTSAGTASITLMLMPGSHSYKAVFSGTPTASPSTSSAGNLQVTGTYPTTTTLTSSGAVGSYSLAAQISGAGPQTMTGNVSFVNTSNSNSSVGSANLVAGTPSLTWVQLSSPVAGPSPAAIVAADFNGDGISDAAALNPNYDAISILLGNADGTFTMSNLSPQTAGTPAAITTGDFNGDGIVDLAVVNGNGIVNIYLGNGDGTFQSFSSITAVASYGVGILSGDFNNDGIADLAISDSAGDKVITLLGKGDGTFTAVSTTASTYYEPGTLAAGDFNNDGNMDIAVANYGGTISLLFGKGDGTFTAAASVTTGANGPGSIVVGDFNHDGVPDLAVSNTYSSTLTIFLGKGDGTFTATNSPTIPYYSGQMTLIDANQDGIVDLFVGASSGTSGTVLLGNGDGTFTLGSPITLPTGMVGIAPARVTNGGYPVLLATFSGLSKALVLEPYIAQSATANVTGVSMGATASNYVAANYSGDTNYSASQSQTITLKGTKNDSIITWATPTSISYGTALSTIQLNATANAAGTFAYTPAVGTVLGAGTQTLSVAFTPTDTISYSDATATVQMVVNKATPSINWVTPAAISYGTALSSTHLNATTGVAGTFSYAPAAGTILGVGTQTLSVTFTPTDTTDYNNATATVAIVVNPQNPVPSISSLAPAFTSAGSTAFTLTVNGNGFVSGSTIYVAATALATQFVNATQLTGSVPASLVASAGTASVTVRSPTPGGGTSNTEVFEVDTAGSVSGAPTFTTITATVTAGSQATYAFTLPASATNVFLSCLNLPTGASCSYSATAGTLTITTSSNTPSGTYQIVAVFTETLPGAATGYILLPFMLVSLWFLRRRTAFRNLWAMLALVVALSTATSMIACGGGGSSSSTTTPPASHQVTSSAALTLIVK